MCICIYIYIYIYICMYSALEVVTLLTVEVCTMCPPHPQSCSIYILERKRGS